MSTAHIDAGANIHGDVGSDVYGNVAGAGLQIGIAALAAGIHQLHSDSAGARLCGCGRYAVKLDAAPARFGVHVSLGRSQADAATTCFNLRRATHIAEVHAAPAGRRFHLPVAMTYGNAAAAGLDQRSLRAGLNFDAAATSLGNQFAVCLANLDGTAAGV